MKSNEILEILKVTRQTLCNYVKQGHIKVTKLGNGYYDYDKKSVYNFLNIDLPNDRTNVIYTRVSTYKQKNDLDKQVSSVKNYCDKNNIYYSMIS